MTSESKVTSSSGDFVAGIRRLAIAATIRGATFGVAFVSLWLLARWILFAYFLQMCSLPSGRDQMEQSALQDGVSVSVKFAETQDASFTPFTALIMSDIHLLGRRKKDTITRTWVNSQISYSISALRSRFQPDIVLLLGDQFDEGSPPTSDALWKEYLEWWQSATLRGQDAPVVYTVGNHDTQFGHRLTSAMLQRYEGSFGPANIIHNFRNVSFVVVNSLVLNSGALDAALRQDTLRFMEKVAKDRQTRQDKPVSKLILLSHLPLYRPDDTACGPVRSKEGGHVTYEEPSFSYSEGYHVVSKMHSADILSSLYPDLILSGHTHALCLYQHEVEATSGDKKAIPEVTVPAFSWGQRPDPSFAIMSVSRYGVYTRICGLPPEWRMFQSTVVCILAAFVLALLFSSRKCLRHRNFYSDDHRKHT